MTSQVLERPAGTVEGAPAPAASGESLAVSTRGLTKRYGDATVVDDMDLEVPEGAVYGFLGPNGAGKSTTMKMLLGLVHASGGEAVVLGREMTPDNRLEVLREVGSLIEAPSCYPHLTARENLLVRTTLLGIPEGRIDEVLETVDLKDTGSKRAGRFSLGMKQRLGIAIALIASPRLLILDEPTNGLDPIGIEELRGLIRSFPKRGITVIVSSHILGEVEQTADDIGIITGGRLAYQAPLQRGQDLEALFMDVCRRTGVAA